MSQLLYLDSKAHAHMGWKPVDTYHYAGRFSVVPVGLEELPRVLPVYPLAFFRPRAEQPLQLVALTGLRPGQNLYVSPEDGRWTAPYRPKAIDLYPFVLQPRPDGAHQYAVGFRVESGALRERPQELLGEHRFFTDDGHQTAAFAHVVKRLNQEVQAAQWATRAAAALQAHHLLEPWPGAQPQGQDAQSLDASVGLFRVHEEKLNALDGPALKALQQANALPLAYGQLLSLGRMEVLQRLAAFYERTRQTAPASTPTNTATTTTAATPDLDMVQKLFEPGQPDTIKFNW